MLELVVHALLHVSFAILLCEHAGCIFYSFEDIHLLFWLFGFISFCQVDGQECLRTSSSYLCFSRLKLYSCYITKFDQVRFEPLCVRSARSPRFVIDLNFQNLFMILGLTDTPLSVLPRSLSWSRFSISVQPIWTFRSHRVATTVYSFASRCHRVVPLGHTDRVGLYTVTGKNLEISPNPFARAIACSALVVSGSSSRRQPPPVAGLRRRRRNSTPSLPP